MTPRDPSASQGKEHRMRKIARDPGNWFHNLMHKIGLR
ncbi:hypothetical protein L083_3890 [Actinoplanes sp. N902-109]|nr:hypothetical protein L083_3890 [Actinoplanes sp. N902-109]